MPKNDKVAAIVQEWIVKAENDLLTASHTLKLGKKCPTDTVCFHAQQCAEKYIKSFLVGEDIKFPRTHDIEVLVSLLPKHIHFPLTIEQQRILTEYAAAARYPGSYEPIPLTEAREAVKLARRVKKEIRRLSEAKPLF
ncbi:MAG: HEPN domain-containing protein [Sedimentisphaerales bacterium]|nr:HEPN domain-containing protein [Sedimentisphaerales bacterium]